MKPYARIPVDLAARSDLHVLPIERRFVFICLFAAARRVPPRWLGYLTDAEGTPRTVRDLAGYMGVPRSTLGRHLHRLHDRHLLERDDSRRWLIPLVIEIEQRIGGTASPHGRSRPRSGERRAANAVENDRQGELPFDGVVPQLWDNLSHLGGTALLLGSRGVDKDNPSSASPLVEKPPDRTAVMDALANVVPNPTIRHLLAGLVVRSSPWAELSRRRAGLNSLAGLSERHPAAVVAALQQAADDPSRIRNPRRWLLRVVPTIARDEMSGSADREEVSA